MAVERVLPWSSPPAETVTRTPVEAVVVGIALAADTLHAGTVVVGARPGRGPQADRFQARARSAERTHDIGAHAGVAGRNRRIRRAVIAQPSSPAKRASPRLRTVARRVKDCPVSQGVVADPGRLHYQVGLSAGHGDAHARGAVVVGIASRR